MYAIRSYYESSARTGLTVFGKRFHRIHLGGHLAGVFEQLQTEFGQRQAPRRAQHQPLAEALFQEGDASRYGRFRQASYNFV